MAWTPRILGTFDVPGRGTVLKVECDREIVKGRDPPLLGTEVFDGERTWTIIGVESWATPIIRSGEAIGLLVKTKGGS